MLIRVQILIVFLLFFNYVLMEFSEFPQLVFVMLDLSVEVKTSSLLLEGAFLFFSLVKRDILLGKKR
jgi:hypothetical protein